MDASAPTSAGHVTKRFLLKVGPAYSTRVAFYFPGYLKMTHEVLDNDNLQIDVCQDHTCTAFASYTKIGRSGHDAHDCPTGPYDVTYTTGTGTVTRTYDPPAAPAAPVMPNLNDAEI